MPGGKMLALVRMDGTDAELLGDQGRLRTKICWGNPPYTSFSCPAEFDGQRLDGPLTFFWDGRLFVVARKHLQGDGQEAHEPLRDPRRLRRRRQLTIGEWGELPSAGDTSYAGVVQLDATHVLLSWYSGDLAAGPGVGARDVRPHEHLAGRRGHVAAAVTRARGSLPPDWGGVASAS